MRIKTDVYSPFPKLSFKPDCDILVNGFNTRERVKYGKELSGDTTVLKDIAALSEKYSLTIISAFDTDNYGIIRHSAAVFDKGKLLGISDMTTAYEDSPYMPGGSGKLFDTSAGKIGVCVGDDIYQYDLIRSFAVCGAEVVVSVRREKPKEIDGVLLRAYAYLTGLPILMLADKKRLAADVKGDLVEITSEDFFDLSPLSEYVLKMTRVKFNK
ncbi:MAG TPA: hypothetical protein DDW54_02380 [Clostridiales bacterium]|nr:hypothetical protein [Clostridiales bacterium]